MRREARARGRRGGSVNEDRAGREGSSGCSGPLDWRSPGGPQSEAGRAEKPGLKEETGGEEEERKSLGDVLVSIRSHGGQKHPRSRPFYTVKKSIVAGRFLITDFISQETACNPGRG